MSKINKSEKSPEEIEVPKIKKESKDKNINPEEIETTDAPKEEISLLQPRTVITGFMAFLSQNSILALAIGLVIGSQSQNMVKALVEGIISPLLAVFLPSDKSLAQMYLEFRGQRILWGQVLQTFIEFIIVLFIVFFTVKVILKKEDILEKKKK